MHKTQYFNGEKWIDTGRECHNWQLAWAVLGNDNYNHRVVNENGEIIIQNREYATTYKEMKDVNGIPHYDITLEDGRKFCVRKSLGDYIKELEVLASNMGKHFNLLT